MEKRSGDLDEASNIAVSRASVVVRVTVLVIVDATEDNSGRACIKSTRRTAREHARDHDPELARRSQKREREPFSGAAENHQ